MPTHRTALTTIHTEGVILPADLVRFLLWLPADEREKVKDLLRAIQDRRWYEVWPEPIIVGGDQE